MTDQELIQMAEEEGFLTAMIATEAIPVDGKFRKYCEDNLCGKYNANFSCPPACGSVEQLHRKLLAKEQALILQTIWQIESYEDKATIEHAKYTHNASVLRLMDRLHKAGVEGFASGYNGCPLCSPCKQAEGKPCPFPEKRISCMSAYCIDVAELAKRCGLAFSWTPGKLHLFGLIAFGEKCLLQNAIK